MLQLAVGPAGVHSDSRETFALLSDVARRYGLRRRTQANEQVDVAVAWEKYGRRPLDLLDEWGWLDRDVTLAHLCDVTPEEIDRIAARGASATHAPGCDVPMGWGVAPVADLADAGVSVGLGTSGGGSNDAGHLWADARLAMQVSGLVGPALSARSVLEMATAGSAQGLGRTELGHLRPGAAADVCVWDVSGVADAGDISRASTNTSLPSLARCSRKKPPPPMPELAGSTTARAIATATAASKALPPSARIS